MLGISSREFNQAKMTRGAPAQAARPTNEAKIELAKMAKAERRQKLLRGDAVHQAFQYVRAIARQEKIPTFSLLSAIADRGLALHNADLGPDEATDDLTAFYADLGRLTRMKETHTEDREGFDNLRASLWDRFSKLLGEGDDYDDAGDDDEVVNPDDSGNPDDSRDAITLENNPTGSLYTDRSSDVSNDTTGQRADSRAPSPVDKNPVTKTRPGFVSKPTPGFHQVDFTQHEREFPGSGGLLLNVTREELRAQARKASKA